MMKFPHYLPGMCLALSLILSVSLNAEELAEASKKQDWDTIQLLLEQQNDVNQAQADGTTALAWAVYWDNVEIAKLLIEAKADVNAPNYLGITPLALAVNNRNPVLVRELLDAGADPEISRWSGETPLMTAAKNGVIEIIRLLIEEGADINRQEPRRGQSALMWAISFGQTDASRLLIESGADISARTKKYTDVEEYTPMLMEGYGGNVEGVAQGGYTPLMFAAKAGDSLTARLLINRGAEINAKSVEDGTALVIASAEGYEKLAIELLNAGADPNISDANGMTALHYSMRDGLKSLLGYVKISAARVCGFNWDTLCKYMETLTEEEKAGLKNPASGLYLVEGEADSNNYERENRLLLPGGNMYELAEALLAKGADVNAAMKYPPARIRLDKGTWMNMAGATPFFLALASLDESAMEMLLEHGANPLVTTEVNHEVFTEQTKMIADDNQVFGNASSLMIASGMGKKETFTAEEEKKSLIAVKKLIELGADVNQTTRTGWTALHAAAYLGATSLAELLIANGAQINVKNGCGRSPLSLAEAENNIGLIRGFPRNENMVKLLTNHGARQTFAASSVGECVLGRYQK